MRLDKFLSDMGVGTRSQLKKIIRGGSVRVEGVSAFDPGMKVDEDTVVTVNDHVVTYERFSYYMLNKPSGVLSACEDKHDKTVLDLFPENIRRGIFPVGRLDKDTVGLLLITNDGGLSHRLLSPGSHIDKVYLARVDGELTEAHVKAFESGLKVDEGFTALPAKLEIIKSAPELSEAKVTIREGKFHQIKRMFEATGTTVTFLKRLSMGSLVLDESLSPGEYRRLSDSEINDLKLL